MNNATKTLLIIFTALTAVTALHFAFGGKGSSAAFSSAVVSFDSTKVTRVVITPSGKPATELEKDGAVWKVAGTNGNAYPADKATVMGALGELLGMKVKAIATRDTAKFSRFQVDTTGTLVELYTGDKRTDAVILGKFNFVNRQEFNTYVRNASKNEVFAVEGFLGSTFGRETDNWRDKNVWKLDEKAVRQVELSFPGDSSWAAFRADGDKWLSGTDSLDTYKTESLVRQAAAITVGQFDETVSPEQAAAGLSITVKVTLDNGTTRELKLGQHPDDGAYYRGVADGYPYVFKLSRSSWDTSVLKGRKAFLKQ
jgi:hypothetical protein